MLLRVPATNSRRHDAVSSFHRRRGDLERGERLNRQNHEERLVGKRHESIRSVERGAVVPGVDDNRDRCDRPARVGPPQCVNEESRAELLAPMRHA
jgi:hypothetical protein